MASPRLTVLVCAAAVPVTSTTAPSTARRLVPILCILPLTRFPFPSFDHLLVFLLLFRCELGPDLPAHDGAHRIEAGPHFLPHGVHLRAVPVQYRADAVLLLPAELQLLGQSRHDAVPAVTMGSGTPLAMLRGRHRNPSHERADGHRGDQQSHCAEA